jgi:aldose 1-epimerase
MNFRSDSRERSGALGKSKEGADIRYFIIGEEGGIQAQVMNWGATVMRLKVPRCEGDGSDDVLLGFDSLAPYLLDHPYFGSTVGRIAGRVRSAAITIDEKRYNLARNEGKNHLHGGASGFHRRPWTVKHFGRNAVIMSSVSQNGAEGYPGRLEMTVTFSIEGGSALRIDYCGVTDRSTPCSPSFHGYFNLRGEGNGEILDHIFEIDARHFFPTRADFTLQDDVTAVDGLPEDFRRKVRLRERIASLTREHGALYFLGSSGTRSRFQRVARVEEESTRRWLEVWTTENCLQFYTGRYLSGDFVGKMGNRYGAYAGFCLECEGCPEALRLDRFPSILLRPGEEYRQTTIYRFGVI